MEVIFEPDRFCQFRSLKPGDTFELKENRHVYLKVHEVNGINAVELETNCLKNIGDFMVVTPLKNCFTVSYYEDQGGSYEN